MKGQKFNGVKIIRETHTIVANQKVQPMKNFSRMGIPYLDDVNEKQA